MNKHYSLRKITIDIGAGGREREGGKIIMNIEHTCGPFPSGERFR